ncbi:hypothetical protein DS407_20820 [Escherichia coli]|nr:hypothetical protein [Escherichia coli]ELX1474461.1 ead/Ea22-like family protein [Escherichia coli]
MSVIHSQALREAAEQAMHDNWGFDADLFHELVTPSIVLTLLDERERNQQYIKRRDQENEDIALTVGKLRVELEAAENNLIDSECHVAELEEALRDKQALLEASEKRIAELEAELVSQTYKLNELSGNSPVTPDGWISCSERMPEKYDFDIWVFSPSRGVLDGLQWDGSMFTDDEYQFVIHDATHWMRKAYPAAPQQDGE